MEDLAQLPSLAVIFLFLVILSFLITLMILLNGGTFAFAHNFPCSLAPQEKKIIVEKCTLKLVDEYRHILWQAAEPLSTLLECITYGHMIANVPLIATGTLHERDVKELLEKCCLLRMFDSIGTELTGDDWGKLYSNFGLLQWLWKIKERMKLMSQWVQKVSSEGDMVKTLILKMKIPGAKMRGRPLSCGSRFDQSCSRHLRKCRPKNVAIAFGISHCSSF